MGVSSFFGYKRRLATSPDQLTRHSHWSLKLRAEAGLPSVAIQEES